MLVAIIDYGSGNLRSAGKAFERVAGSRADIRVTSDPKLLKDASHIVLPGVGAFADCMRGLKAVPGMLDALEEQVRQKHKPFLGVCVGMQMLFDEGHEHGVHQGLGWIEGKVVKIGIRDRGLGVGDTNQSPRPKAQSLKIPHMGWNELDLHAYTHPLLNGLKTGDHAYFVHSYHAICDGRYILATTDYGEPLTAIVGKDTIFGTQFHPEKSQEAGLKLIGNFLKLA